ncbi:MAG: 50S ribosomal protein L9 [bacterium]|nr:50S ribosomal protein L9 [bacterium]
MKVIILKENVVKDVSEGYARNYLLPNKLAIIATPADLKRREAELQVNEANRRKQIKEDQEMISQFSGKSFTIKVDKIGEKGKLFGSITAKEVAEAMKLKKENILLKESVKTAGKHEVEIKIGQFHEKVIIEIVHS